MSAMDRIEHEHARAVLADRAELDREQAHGEQLICAAVAACQSLPALPAWVLRDNIDWIREALYHAEHALEKAEVTQ